MIRAWSIGLVLMMLLFAVPSAFAISLDEAKNRGLVGETPSGYLEPVSGGGGEVQQLVSSTNAKRREKYNEIAKKNGTQLSAVEALAGKKAIEETPSGQFVKLPSGQWQKK